MNRKYTPIAMTIISLFTTISMFFKLQNDYSMLEIVKPLIFDIKTDQSYIVTLFNTFNYEYIIGMVILLFCVFILFYYIIDEYYILRSSQNE